MVSFILGLDTIDTMVICHRDISDTSQLQKVPYVSQAYFEILGKIAC